jgi:hypothetical protein
LREKHKLRVFEHVALGRGGEGFGPEKHELTGNWRRRHNEGLWGSVVVRALRY